MKLFDAYCLAINEEDDPIERTELTATPDLKQLMVEEIGDTMKEAREAVKAARPIAEVIKPLFNCVAFWFIIGIRVGKILRDAEIEEAEEHSAE